MVATIGLLVTAVFAVFAALGYTANDMLTGDAAFWFNVAFIAVGLLFSVAGMLLSALAQPLFHPPRAVFAACFQCGFRFNTYVALAVASRLAGEQGLALISLLVGLILAFVGLYQGLALGFPLSPVTPLLTPGKTLGPALAAAIPIVLWNYMGWDNASTVAGEVERPQRNYPLAMLGALALVGALVAGVGVELVVVEQGVDPKDANNGIGDGCGELFDRGHRRFLSGWRWVRRLIFRSPWNCGATSISGGAWCRETADSSKCRDPRSVSASCSALGSSLTEVSAMKSERVGITSRLRPAMLRTPGRVPMTSRTWLKWVRKRP